MNRARDREHVAVLLGGEARGDQRTAGERRFDDEHAAGKAADQAIAARKIAGQRRRAESEFGQHAALGGEPVGRSRLAAG